LNKRIVELTNKGVSHLKDEVLEKELKKLKGKIIASTDAEKGIKEASTIIVCVPTPINEEKLPDLTALENACKTIAQYLRKGQLVIIESTIYPGVTEEIAKPILEKSGLIAEKDFFLAHCPERIDPGNKKWTIEKIPRVLAGTGKNSTKNAKEFYKKIINAQIVELNSVKAAEAVKVTENTFRDINIAFVNELAKSFAGMGIDITEVIKGASTKPFGYMPFYPGPGVGGHCISVDPYYLIERARQKGFNHKFLLLARKINDSMAEFVVEQAKNVLAGFGKEIKNSKIAVLGVAYKPNIDDSRESPALRIIELLKGKGAELKIFDPYIKQKSNVSSIEEALKGVDLLVLTTQHTQFVKFLKPKKLKSFGIKAVIDARNCLEKEKISSLGIKYMGIGR